MASLDSKDLTEKKLAAGLGAAVNQHDAEAAKEEISTVGRGTHTRQVSVVDSHLQRFRNVMLRRISTKIVRG